MSEFEFMRGMTFGQYLPTGSMIHRLDARARIVIFTAILGAVTISRSYTGLILSLVMACVGLALASIPLRYALQGLLPPLPFLVVLAVLQVFLNPGDGEVLFQFWVMKLTAHGLFTGAMLLLRFLSLVLGLTLTTFTLSSSELILGLHLLLRPLGRLGLPVQDVVFMVQATLRFIPFLMQSAERVVKAQASRGAPWGKGSGGPLRRARQAMPMILPLFMNSLRRAENLALAMDARGYGSHDERTSMYELHFRLLDWFALGVSFLLAAGIVAWGR